MELDLGGMLAAPSNGDVFSVDWQVFGSDIRDDSRHSRVAFFWPTGCELLMFEKMLREDN